MPRNGYWVECVPLNSNGHPAHLLKEPPDLYSASSASFPEITETAHSPDQAIEQLRDRLRNIRQQYHRTGKLLPEMDNPVRPPTRLRAIQGWISVYIEMGSDGRAPKATILNSLLGVGLIAATAC